MKSIVLMWVCIAGLAMTGGGCATITQGTTQPINIDSDPNGADCTLTREGQALSSVTTPAPVTIKRHASTIHVVCKKAGYEDGRVIMNSRFETASAGNVLLGGIIGVMVDASSGANTRYENYVLVRLNPLVGGQVPPAQPAPPAKPEAAKPAVAVAAPPPPSPGPFDGDYTGGVALGGTRGGTRGGASLRQIEVQVSSGTGTGTARFELCREAGEVRLTVDPSGAVSGTVDLLSGGACGPLKGAVEGQATADRLMLKGQYDGKTVEFSLTRKGKAG